MPQRITIGVDEVGRGPWAGPLTAAAVALDSRVLVEGVKDSKLLNPEQRAELFREIAGSAVSIGIGWCHQKRLDRLGLQPATSEAMQTALEQLGSIDGDIVVDGSFNYLADTPGARTVVGADMSVPSVSAASIVAKHMRDQYMCRLARIYPGYGFELHKGYGTAAHRQALEDLGVCDLHRRSFAPIKLLIGS